MPKQTNALPKNTLKDSPPPIAENTEKKRVRAKSSLKEENLNPQIGGKEKIAQVVGIFALLMSVFLFFCSVSFFINWFSGQTDDALSSLPVNKLLSNTSIHANNAGGRLGAFVSNLLIKEGFGIGSFFITLWLFILGVRLSLKHKFISLGYSFAIAIIGMTWFSTTLGFVFRNTSLSIFGGITGFESANYLEGLAGKVGLLLILFFTFIAFLVIVYNFSLHNFKPWKKSKTESIPAENTESEMIRNTTTSVNTPVDKYNTIEFAVDENEKAFPQNTNPIAEEKRNIRNEIQFEPIEVTPPKVKNQQTEVEFTVENQAGSTDDFDVVTPIVAPKEPIVVSTPVQQVKPNTERISNIDTPFDPHLELAEFRLPSVELLDEYGAGNIQVNKEELEANKNRIVSTLGNYGIQIDKIKATIGPTVTLYEIIPAPGVRISKIKNLEDDIALSLSALGIRIIAPIPGKGTIGIEVPNQKPAIVGMKSVLSSEKFNSNSYDLPFAIGKTISNEEFVADLTKMPHILMAGATGQGKSVGLNAIITSLLYKKHPSELKFVMVDPKKVELTLFSKIERHYLAKLPDSEEAIITDTRKVVRTLNSLNIEMDARYDLLKDAQVRNIKEYNIKFIARKLNPLQGHRFLPYIVVVIDEFADLILTAGKEVEHPITRLAQLARAIGIHLVIATQRPSVNIITGTIKANFPARIAFRVISKIDSRTILDTGGADQLIGRGDLLLSQGGDTIRLQCAFIDTHEVDRITDFIGSQRGYPNAFSLPEFNEDEPELLTDTDPGERDELFEEAAYLIVAAQQGSTSLIQRKLKLGYNRAGRIIDQLESAGIVGPFEGSKAREVKVANEFALEQFLKDIYNRENKNNLD